MTATRLRHAPAALLGLVVLAWSVGWALQALTLWRHDHVCALVAGPFLPCGPGHLAWQQPLLIALLPAALLGAAWSLCQMVRILRKPRT